MGRDEEQAIHNDDAQERASEVEEVVCGETIDHDLWERDSRDGMTVFECRRCGAEIIEEGE